MDDVNMSSMICEEDISKELQQFNVRLDDSDVLAKCEWWTTTRWWSFVV